MAAVGVTFAVPVETVFDYLADPNNRAAWQSSLRTVNRVVGEGGLGTSWRDRTWPGLSPLMHVTLHERPHRWSETGSWRGLTADLVLGFRAPAPHTTEVTAEFRFAGKGIWRPVAAVAAYASPPAIRSDLRRAARILESRG